MPKYNSLLIRGHGQAIFLEKLPVHAEIGNRGGGSLPVVPPSRHHRRILQLTLPSLRVCGWFSKSALATWKAFMSTDGAKRVG